MSDGTGALAMRDLTEQERTLFLAELGGSRKDTTVAVLLCLFLGGLGAHRFYLGQSLLGILYICCFIPYWILSMLLFFGIPLIHRAGSRRAQLQRPHRAADRIPAEGAAACVGRPARCRGRRAVSVTGAADPFTSNAQLRVPTPPRRR